MKLHKTLNVLEADVRPLFLLGALHFIVAASHALFDIGATSLLVAHLGPEALPPVYIGSALLLIVTGLFVIPIIDRLDRAKLFSVALVLFATFLAASHHMGDRAPEIVYRGLYLMCYLMKGLLFLQFWLIAGDIYELRQAKRLFPILLGFSLAGGLAASIAASILPRWIVTEDLLLTAAILLFLGLLPIQPVARLYRERLRPAPIHAKFRLRDRLRQLRSDLSVALGSSLLRNLSLCFLLFGLLAQVMDYLMGKAASLHYVDSSGAVDPQSLTAFYAVLNGAVIGIGALTQFLLANRFISSVGVTRGQLAGPLTFLIAFSAIGIALLTTGNQLGTVFFFTVLAGRAIQKVIRISIYRSSTDLIFNPIPSERRGRAKAFKETVIEPTGALVGGLFLIVSATFGLGVLIVVSMILSAVFLLWSLELKSLYLDSLVHVLKEKSRFRFAFPSTVMRPVPSTSKRIGVVSDLERALDDQEVSVRLLAVEVASELREPAAAPLLVRRFRQEPDPKVRATMVAALGKLLRRRSDSLGALEPSLDDQDPRVRANGIEALAQLGLSESASFLPAFTDDAEPRIRANTAVAYSRLVEDQGREAGREILLDMFDSGNESTRVAGVYGLGEIADEKALTHLETALHNPSSSIRQRALMSLARSGRRKAIDRLVQLLEEEGGATRHMATRALTSCGDAAVNPLIIALWSCDAEVRRFVIQALGKIGTSPAHQALIHFLSLEAEEAYYDLVRVGKLEQLPQTNGVVILVQSLLDRVTQAKTNVLRVLHTVYGDRRGMRLILSNLNHPEPYVRASALEALEVRVDPSLIGGILPLFEHSRAEAVAEHGSSVFRLPSKQPIEVLFELASDRSKWLRACALYAMGQVAGEKALPLLERRLYDTYELARLNAIEAMGRVANTSGVTLLEGLGETSEERVLKYSETAIRRIRDRENPSDS